jgi:hypothetical protein
MPVLGLNVLYLWNRLNPVHHQTNLILKVLKIIVLQTQRRHGGVSGSVQATMTPHLVITRVKALKGMRPDRQKGRAWKLKEGRVQMVGRKLDTFPPARGEFD